MSKSKITIQKSDDLEAVDLELADAMSLLDQTNERINDVLRSFSPTERSAAEDISDAPPEAETAQPEAQTPQPEAAPPTPAEA